jgi:hypothetical protein
VTLLGTDKKSCSNTYLAQLSLQSSTLGVLNDLIEVQSSYSGNGDNKDASKSSKQANETNLLMIKAEKLAAKSIVKCIKKSKTSGFCVSSSRKVAALLSDTRQRVRIFELEVEDDENEGEAEKADSESSDELKQPSASYVTNNVNYVNNNGSYQQQVQVANNQNYLVMTSNEQHQTNGNVSADIQNNQSANFSTCFMRSKRFEF